jgi:serine phosphatase RsbU (regulator of sigma subunit)
LSEIALFPASILCLMMAAVTAFAGVYHLISFAMRRQERLHLPFAGLCLSVSAYDVFATGLYEAPSVAEGVAWQAHELRAGCLISIFAIWFVFVFTEQPLGHLLRAQLAWFAALFALSWLPWPGFALSAAEPAIKHVRIPGLLQATYHEAELGVLQLVSCASFIAAYVYLLRLLQRYHAGARQRGALWVAAGQYTYFAGMTNDALVATGAYDFVYISEYCFFFVVMAMFVVLLREFVRARACVEELNTVLDSRVAERTAALAQTNDELHAALAELRRRDERLFANIEQAREFQERILPAIPRDERVIFDVVYRALEVVSGDIFDICELQPGRYRLFLADATGHGVQAAMRTTLLKTEYDRFKYQSPDPAHLLESLSARLVQLFPNGEAMATAACVDLTLDADGASGAVSCAAGPGPLLHAHGETTEIETHGTFLGVRHQHWPRAAPFRLEPGSTLLLFSDGFIEQIDATRAAFSPIEALATLRADPTELARALATELDRFRGTVHLRDDVTLIAVTLAV